jgi:hypothetical protein
LEQPRLPSPFPKMVISASSSGRLDTICPHRPPIVVPSEWIAFGQRHTIRGYDTSCTRSMCARARGAAASQPLARAEIMPRSRKGQNDTPAAKRSPQENGDRAGLGSEAQPRNTLKPSDCNAMDRIFSGLSRRS